MIAWIKRFGKSARNLPKDRIFGNITFSEYAEAENILLKLIQEESFEPHEDKKIESLQHFVDEKELMRTTTNIPRRNDSGNFRSPIILPPNDVITNLLNKEKHEETSHAGIQALMSILRGQF
ncbi:uncharacterized protein LOC118190650 [Stegodyphus dumicola]|uniref:uncharacterized protein LOC118190650 n=1 Tax=Stegodyphus dumicola TaxID=202533 RepID=UPI0015B227A3|nr:uncharacterized protein LOC118190650 [Stegodyphus dumicola]